MPEVDPPIDATGLIVGTHTKVLNDSYCYTTQHFLALVSSTRVFCGGGESGSPSKGDSGGGLFGISCSDWIQYQIISVSLSKPRGGSTEINMNEKKRV